MIKYNKVYLLNILKKHDYDCKVFTPEWALFALEIIQTETLEKILKK